jgi:hypothetical protein
MRTLSLVFVSSVSAALFNYFKMPDLSSRSITNVDNLAFKQEFSHFLEDLNKYYCEKRLACEGSIKMIVKKIDSLSIFGKAERMHLRNELMLDKYESSLNRLSAFVPVKLPWYSRKTSEHKAMESAVASLKTAMSFFKEGSDVSIQRAVNMLKLAFNTYLPALYPFFQ